MAKTRHTPEDELFFRIRSLASVAASGSQIRAHRHDWHQLIYAARGVMTVWTEVGSWIAPPQRAVWVPAGVSHAIAFAGETHLRTLYLRPGDLGAGPALPAGCAAVAVSGLLRELIDRAVRLGMLDRRDGVQRALARLIIAEIAPLTAPPFDLPQPRTEAVARAARAILAAPRRTRLREAAAEAGMAPRTLERRFVAETGLSLGQWSRQAVLLEALRRLATGEAVKAVSEASGYADPSAFVAAFKAMFGRTPGGYFAPAP